MTSHQKKNNSDDVVYDCTLGKHTLILGSGELVIDCVVETKAAVDEPRIDIHV